MKIFSFEPVGFEGQLVTVEVDIRRGIPALDIVGLPDGAVREAGARVRSAIRNSGFDYSMDRILVNLAPAGLPKAGAAFDLSIAISILVASAQLPLPREDILALGELELSGAVREVTGVMPAVAEGLKAGIRRFIVPRANLSEAKVLVGNDAVAIDDLSSLTGLLAMSGDSVRFADNPELPEAMPCRDDEDIGDICGQPNLKRALEIAAAGGHHVLLFGPPGVGKTMAGRRLSGLLPLLDDEDAFILTKLHSLAGALPQGGGLLRRPPFRAPHHSASPEGLLGGGRLSRPGEISLAHGGVLFLDEAPEFRADILQSLREPLEDGIISLARAERVVRYPSCFQLVLACNPCPCGNLGRDGAVCLCSYQDIRRYWKRLGGALLDRIDIRIPLHPIDPTELIRGSGEHSDAVRVRVGAARQRQRRRYAKDPWKLNARLSPQGIASHVTLEGTARDHFSRLAREACLSSRACHGILKVARTIADLDGSDGIQREQLDEAFSLRRYGEEDLSWQIP